MKKLSILFLSLLSITFVAKAQPDAQPETDPVILNRIDQWQDLKFGFLGHVRTVGSGGVVEHLQRAMD